MSVVQVREALTTSVVALLKASPISIADANIISGNMPSPHQSSKWVQILFTSRPPYVATLGGGGKDCLEGVLFVNLRIPMDNGELPGLQVVDTFRAALPAGSRLTFEGQEVTVLSIGSVDGRVVDGFWRTDITIPYRAFIKRGA